MKEDEKIPAKRMTPGRKEKAKRGCPREEPDEGFATETR
jgi:hypothetical protein